MSQENSSTEVLQKEAEFCGKSEDEIGKAAESRANSPKLEAAGEGWGFDEFHSRPPYAAGVQSILNADSVQQANSRIFVDLEGRR